LDGLSLDQVPDSDSGTGDIFSLDRVPESDSGENLDRVQHIHSGSRTHCNAGSISNGVDESGGR
jgi:hypothetical protein